jgi:hypothetical protein
MTDPTSTAGYASTGPTALNSVSAAIAPAGNNVYAGMAFEVHLLATSGTDTPIDPASYTFNTGDRFLVYYRPSLPGGVDVYNINPAGKTSHIDFVTVAAGQLATLGPYEFADTSGDEGLKFVLAPCSDAKLLATTRGIVRHAPAAAANQTEPGIALPTCGAHSTRGLTTAVRDIRKVGTEGGTTFALDPVSQQELQSGNVASRTVTITLHHH